MPVRSLGTLIKNFATSALLIVGAACGTSTRSTKTCSGCQFLLATTDASQILTFPTQSGGILGMPATTQGPADSQAILVSNGGPIFLSDSTANVLDAFDVNSTNGALSPATGSPFSLAGSPGTPTSLLAFGNYLYVGDTNGTVSAFSISSSGAISTIVGSPYPAGVAPSDLVSGYTSASPQIDVLYAADQVGGGIWAFTIAPDGELTAVPGSPFSSTMNASAVNPAPAGMFVGGNAISGSILYVALSGLNQIIAFSINADGALTRLAGSPFPAGGGPTALCSGGPFLYAMNASDHTVSAYNVDSNTGALTAINGSPFAAGTATGEPIYSNGTLYVPDTQSKSILAYSVDDSTGALTPLPGSPFAMGAGPLALAALQLPVLDPP